MDYKEWNFYIINTTLDILDIMNGISEESFPLKICNLQMFVIFNVNFR